MISPTVLNTPTVLSTPHGTAHTLYKVIVVMSNQAEISEKKRISSSGTLFSYFGPPEKEKEKENQERDILYQQRNDRNNTQNPEDQMNDKRLYFNALVFREEIKQTNASICKIDFTAPY